MPLNQIVVIILISVKGLKIGGIKNYINQKKNILL